MSSFFDIDISFEADDQARIHTIPAAKLLAAIEPLPESLKEVAMGVFYEKRTFSDVSQSLGIRQSELVSRLHRAQLAIAMHLMSHNG